jgi:four helix bundle protein
MTTRDNREMGQVKGFEDLVVWQRGMQLVKEVYLISRDFPTEERFGLTSQMRRAAISVPSNIAEGHERHTTREFVRFVSHAEGSLGEIRTQLRIAVDLQYCSDDATSPIFELMDEVRRMLNGLRRTLNAKQGGD